MRYTIENSMNYELSVLKPEYVREDLVLDYSNLEYVHYLFITVLIDNENLIYELRSSFMVWEIVMLYLSTQRIKSLIEEYKKEDDLYSNTVELIRRYFPDYEI